MVLIGESFVLRMFGEGGELEDVAAKWGDARTSSRVSGESDTEN